MNVIEWAQENTPLLVGSTGAYVGYVKFGSGSYPSIPEWAPLVLGAAIVVGLVALGTSGRLEDLLPEEQGVYLQVVNASNTEVIETWELSEDQFEDITVVGGQLNHLSECTHRAYECLAYDDEENLAVATWRRSRPASAIVGNHEVSDALDLMQEIRSDLEPEARFSSLLRRRVPSII
jgi:hypothetical protein